MKYKLPLLTYAYDALEPFFDAKTMEIHHSRHHQGYTDKLNDALKGTPFANDPIENILVRVSELPATIRNNGGGHYNHSLFWSVITPVGTGAPAGGGDLEKALIDTFGSFDSFRDEFSNAAAARFGSGWAWLIVTDDNQLKVTSTPNQDNPLMDVADVHGIPVLGLDVWEHAYYLNYQNRRPDYIEAFWHIVNWDAVERNYLLARIVNKSSGHMKNHEQIDPEEANARVISTVTSWDGITSGTHAMGGVDFKFGTINLGHLHDPPGRIPLADLRLPKTVRDEIVVSGRARNHVTDKEGKSDWMAVPMRTLVEADLAIAFFRMAYEWAGRTIKKPQVS